MTSKYMRPLVSPFEPASCPSWHLICPPNHTEWVRRGGGGTESCRHKSRTLSPPRSPGGRSLKSVLSGSPWPVERHIGAVPRLCCYTERGELLGPDKPVGRNSVKGHVIARLVRKAGNGRFLIAIPDGVVVVDEGQLTRVEEMRPDVPAQS